MKQFPVYNYVLCVFIIAEMERIGICLKQNDYVTNNFDSHVHVYMTRVSIFRSR
jgi:hypothetical protein